MWVLDEGVMPELITSPGAQVLFAGDSQAGYYGLVAASDLINGPDLATWAGLTAGTRINDTVDWMKFAYQGKVLFVPKKPLRYNLSWDQLNAAGLVTGKQLTLGKFKYTVRLMHGSLANPYRGLNDASDDPRTAGSEYNALMYRVCVTNPASESGVAFAAFTQDELGTVGNGGCQLCIERSTPTNSNAGVLARGNASGDFATAHSPPSSLVDAYRGWRPVLELVP